MGLLFLSGERVSLKRRKLEMLDVNKLSWRSGGIPPTLPSIQNTAGAAIPEVPKGDGR